MNRPLPLSAQAAKAKLLGFQLANPSGCIIQGDDDDPLALMSFQIMSPAYAVKAVEKLGDSPRYLLMPIYEGDVEDATFSTSIFRKLLNDQTFKSRRDARLRQGDRPR